MKREFLIDRQGKQFVLYAGLLDLAHERGLVSIQTEAITVTADLAMFKATVTMANEKDGARTFEGHGDATPANVGRNIIPHFIRMAETRAKARALRDALNIGAAALEELGDMDDVEGGHVPPPRPAPPPRQAPAPPRVPESSHAAPQDEDDPFAGMPGVAPTPINQAQRARTFAPQQAAPTGDLATPAQVRAIYLIGRDQHGMDDQAIDERSVSLYQRPPAELTKKQASHLITVLKANGQAG